MQFLCDLTANPTRFVSLKVISVDPTNDRRDTKRGRDTHCNVHRVSLIKRRRHDRRSIYFPPVRRVDRELRFSSTTPSFVHLSSATSPSTKYIILPNRIKSSHDVTYRSSVVNSIYRPSRQRLFALNARQAFFNRGLSATRSSNE